MSINHCVFMGNLGVDPDLRYLPDGREVVNISVACTEKWKDANGEIKENTEWIRAVCFGKRAKAIAEYFKKGSQIHITTKSRTRKYQASDGTDRWTTEYVISDFQFCGQRSGDSGDTRAKQQAAAYGQAPTDPNAPPTSAYANAGPHPGDDFDDDSILF